MVSKSTNFVGFDSAWTNNLEAPGAICAVHLRDGQLQGQIAPTLASFEAALHHVRSFCTPDALNLIAFDQPTIVPNITGSRPVERVAGSVITWIGGGVQPANRQRLGMFDDAAPVWHFLNDLQAIENPERARTQESRPLSYRSLSGACVAYSEFSVLWPVNGTSL